MSQFMIGSTNGPALNETNALWIRLPRITTTDRDSLLTPNPPQTGALIDNISSNVLQRWNGSIWQDIVIGTAPNIYNSNGTLTGQREVLLNGNSLQFLNQTATGTTSIYMNDNTISINANNSLFAAPNTNNINTQWLQSDNGANWFLELATSLTVNTLELTSLTLSDVVRFIYRDGNVIKTGLQYLEFGESDWEDSGATADYSNLKNNSLVPKRWVTDLVSNQVMQLGNSFNANMIIGTNDNFSLSLETAGITKARFDIDGGLELFNLAVDRYALTLTNTLDNNNYTKWVGTSTDYLLGFQSSRFLVKNNLTNADMLSYSHATNQLTLGNNTISQNVISLPNSNAGYAGAAIGLNSTRKFYYTDGTTVRFWIKPSNVLAVETLAYESLVLLDNDIPNRKWVTDLTQNQILQLGNTFGSNIIIGTNDTYAFNIKTDNIIRFNIDTLGKIVFPNTLGILPKLEFNNVSSDYNIIQMTGVTSNIQFGQFGLNLFAVEINSANSLSLTNTGTLNQLNIGANTNTSNHIEFLNAANASRIGNNGSHNFFVYDPALVGNRFTVNPNGVLTVGDTLVYENLVLLDNDIPNRKWITDLFANNILQNGNSFGANITIGTNDNFSLNLETNGVTKWAISPLGAINHTYTDTTGVIAGLRIENLGNSNGVSTIDMIANNSIPLQWRHRIGAQSGAFSFTDVTNSRSIMSVGASAGTGHTLAFGANVYPVAVLSMISSTLTAELRVDASRKFAIRTDSIDRLELTTTNVWNTDTPLYETLVIADGHIPNRKWVVDNTLTSLYPQGRIFWVSKSGNDSIGTVGRIDRPYLTIQAAVTAATSNNDVIHILPGAYTENVVLPATNITRHFIFENATLIGSLTNSLINSVPFGTITGIGSSFITSGVTITGNASNIDRIFNMRLNVLSSGVNIHDSCIISVTAAGTLTGIYTNCTISTGVTLVSQYGASVGFTLKDSTISCGNFVEATGGLTSSGGNFIIRNCKITCTNFLSARGSSVLQITESQVRASGNAYFINADGGGVWKVYASNCLFETGCTFLNQNTTDTDSIFNVISNKTTNGAFNGTLTVVSTLNII